MAFPVSPGVVVTERPLDTYVPGVATAVGAFAGVFRWGPVGERTLLDGEQSTAKRFGAPTNFNPETFFTIANFFAYSDQAYVVRAANTTGTSPVITGNVEAANSIVLVSNSATISNGMIIVATDDANALVVGTTVNVVNSTALQLSSNSAAAATNTAVSFQLVSNTTAFNAIVNSAAVANLTNQIVKTEDTFNTKLDNGDFDADVHFVAKWPGELGNSLKVSVIDTAAAYQSNVDLSNTSTLTSNIAFTVDSNTASLSFGANSDLNTWDVNTFNTFVGNTVAGLTVGDYILAGNTTLGTQLMQVSALPTLANVELSANAAATANVDDGNSTITTTSNGFTTAGFVNGQWVAIWANTTVWETFKIQEVSDGNTIVLETNADFTNTASNIAALSNTYVTGSISFVDKYKRASNSSLTTLARYWEYYTTFDTGPGQSTTVRLTGNTSANDEMHLVVVDEDGKFTGVPGTILEKFERISRANNATNDDGKDSYYKTVLNSTSEYIWAVNDRSGAATANVNNVASSTNLTPFTRSFALGQDGTDEGNVAIQVLTDAYDMFGSADDVDISLIMTGKSRGGSAGAQLSNYLIDNIAEPRMDCVVFVSPDKADVVNNVGQEATDIVAFRNTLRDTSYGFLDSGYKYQYDRYNDVYRYIPLNGDIAGLAARTEQTNDAWWSFAGFNRGKIKNIVRLPYNPTKKADRDLLYKNGVNPVMTVPGDGTLLYGDKTLLSKPSAFDRINVRRLFIVLEKAIAKASKYSLFEFNDAFTRAQFRNLVVPFLRDVQGRRGLTDFLVVCDSTNNPPSVIDRNEFVGDIYIKPNKSINFIQLNFYSVPTGISFTEVVT